MKQSEAFCKGEGDAWYRRNKHKLGIGEDPVIEILKQCPFIKPRRILELGCSNGWRLRELGVLYDIGPDRLHGTDPSIDAISDGNQTDLLWLEQGIASDIVYRSVMFDMVILGFCMYLVDREDLFLVAAEVDKVLKDNGCLVILDFVPPVAPYKVPYKHKEGIWSYHMDYPKLFLANPAYKPVVSYAPSTAPGEPDTLVSVLQKKVALAYPEGEPVI